LPKTFFCESRDAGRKKSQQPNARALVYEARTKLKGATVPREKRSARKAALVKGAAKGNKLFAGSPVAGTACVCMFDLIKFPRVKKKPESQGRDANPWQKV